MKDVITVQMRRIHRQQRCLLCASGQAIEEMASLVQQRTATIQSVHQHLEARAHPILSNAVFNRKTSFNQGYQNAVDSASTFSQVARQLSDSPRLAIRPSDQSIHHLNQSTMAGRGCWGFGGRNFRGRVRHSVGLLSVGKALFCAGFGSQSNRRLLTTRVSARILKKTKQDAVPFFKNGRDLQSGVTYE